MIEVNNHVEPEYKAPCIIVIAGKAFTEFENPRLLNGFAQMDYDYVANMSTNRFKLKMSSELNFMWNETDKSMYSVNKLVTGLPLSEEDLRVVGKKIQKQWVAVANPIYAEESIMHLEGEEEVFITPSPKDQELFVSQMPIEIPRGHYWLGTLFDTPDKQVMYEEFMVEPVVFDRFVKMCEDKRIPIPKGVTTTSGLPIHKKDGNTGEILISENTLKVFKQYQFARNYLSFDVGTQEYDLGKVLLLVPKFCDYMMHVAERITAGKETSTDNYMVQLNDAIKYIQKKPSLIKLYESNLVYES